MKLLIILLGAMTLSGCSVANYIRLKYENDDIQPHWQAGQTTTKVDAQISAKPYVYMSINGVHGFKMMIDTGASISILYDSKKVKALALKEGYSLELGGWGDGKNSLGFQTDVSEIQLGNVSFQGVSFAYLPVTESEYFLRADEAVFDGILGHDILKHFTWYIDSKAGSIEISREPYKPSEQDISIPMRVSLSKLYFDSEIDLGDNQTMSQELVLDTGSRHYFKLNNYHVRDLGYEFKGKTVTGSDFGLSGQTIHQRGTIPSLQVAGLELSNVKTNFIEGGDDGKSVIGSSVLSHFNYVIDYHNLSLYLKPYKSVVFNARYNLLGLELRKLVSGAFVVRYVMPDMAAFGAGIKVGDEVLSFNGVEAHRLSQKDWIDVSATQGEHELCISRDNLCFKLSADHVAGYSNDFKY
ncbi:aspartyl protease family protein [Pseudoalteromonas obscura]|uniref:Aspartyl protease family protein n=1 Tax=Pseudoalteromonas obscura TaxID=3048491 RepID=A0ABT7EGI9_9GAMM|nr:aspartyl protease family protein [Pseudoalteromonas sp. P94(2023)]MDK2594154.1 aspartyl protease family protein [Pseudoalteromonas sp. P94(2023)]